MRHLIISLVIVAIAQSLAYLQLQSQFFWTWAKDHPLMMSLYIRLLSSTTNFTICSGVIVLA